MSPASFYTTGLKGLRHGKDIISLVEPNGSFGDLFRPENGVWWLHCSNPSLDEIYSLSRAMHLHELTTEDITDAGVPDKFEQFDDYFFVVYALDDSNRLCIVTTAFGVLTLFVGNAEFDVEALSLRLQTLSESFRSDVLTPESITYAFIDKITDSFEPKVVKVQKEASVIERELFLHNGQTEVVSLLNRMCQARDSSVELMRLFQSKPAVLKSLLKRDKRDSTASHASSRLLLSANGHLTEMTQSTFALEAMVARSFVNYISIMRVKMVHSNSTMEQIAGAVALTGLVLLPSHLITSAWAMNIPVPGQDKHGEGWFWGVISVMTTIVFCCGAVGLWYYRRAVSGAQITMMLGKPDYQGPG